VVIVDKGHILKLAQDADVVLVAQPEIANAVIESPRLIFILGKKPGETNLFVMDRAGNLIVKSDVVVVPNEQRQVTIHRGEKSTTMKCLPLCLGTGQAAPAASSPKS
jgi:Flp pilus assembly secretin CpaC